MRTLISLISLCLLLTATLALAQEQPLGYLMLYNAGPAPRQGVALGSVPDLGFTLPAAGIVVRDGDQELPAQVSGDTLGVYVALQGYEHKRVAVYAGKPAATVPMPLRHSEDQVAWMTLGTNYNLRIDKQRRGVSGLQLGGDSFDGGPEWDVWIFPPTKDDRKDLWTLEPPKKVADATDFLCEPLAGGPLFTRYRLSWSCEQAKVVETVTLCTGDPFAQFDVQTEIVQPVCQVVFKYQLPYRFDQANTVFYPLGERVVGYYEGYKSYYDGRYDPAPGWVLGWSPKANGLGFAVPDRGLFTRLAYAVRSPDDVGYFRNKSSKGKTGPAFFMCAQSENLSEVPPGTVLSGTVYCFTQKDPAQAGDTVALIKSPLRLRRAEVVDLEGVVGLPATLPLGGETKAPVHVRNWGAQPAQATLRVAPVQKEAMGIAVPPTNAALAPGGGQDSNLGLTPRARGPQEVLVGCSEALSRLRIEAHPPVTVEKVWPNKVLYANNEEARCEVTLRNWQDQPAKVDLVTTLRGDLDQSETLDKRAVALQPREEQKLTLTWNTGKREYGYEIEVAASQSGKTLDSAREYFGIASDWLKIMQDGGSRLYYQNVIRIHNHQAIDGTLDVPEGDYEIWTSDHNYYSNGTELRRLIKELKDQGIKPCFYLYAAATPWGAVDYGRDPQKILYTADGHAATDWGQVPNIYAQGFRDWLVDQIDKAIDHLGWEACFLDVSQGPPQNARELLDWQGRPAGAELGPDPDSIGAAWFTDVRGRVRAKHPGFTNMHNPEVFKSEFQFPKSFVAAGKMSMIEIGGGGGAITYKDMKYGRWTSLIEVFNSVRATKHRYGVEAVRSYPLTVAAMGGDTCCRTMQAISFASGFNTANVAYPPGSIYGDVLRNYLQFATRYSALLYHDKIKWIPPEEVQATVEAPAGVLWKQYVFQRDLGQEVDSLLHLVQLPPDPFIYRRPGKQAKITGLKATAPLPQGTSLRDVWLLSPDRATRAERLAAQVQGGKVSFTIPDLEVYDVVVVRCARGG
jgi:hypothetical protein